MFFVCPAMCSSQSTNWAAARPLALPVGECHFPYSTAATVSCQEIFVDESDFFTFIALFCSSAVSFLLDRDDFVVYNLNTP